MKTIPCAIASIFLLVAGTAAAEAPRDPRVGAVEAGPPQETSPDGERFKVDVRLDWTLFFGPGAGGSIGLAKGHWDAGIMGLATPLQPLFRDLFLTNAHGLTVPLSVGGEVYVDYFFDSRRRWLFVGGILSADYFKVRNGDSTDSLVALYVVPRIGIKLNFTPWLFIEPSVAATFRLWDSGPVQVGGTSVGIQPVGLVLGLPLGVEF